MPGRVISRAVRLARAISIGCARSFVTSTITWRRIAKQKGKALVRSAKIAPSARPALLAFVCLGPRCVPKPAATRHSIAAPTRCVRRTPLAPPMDLALCRCARSRVPVMPIVRRHTCAPTTETRSKMSSMAFAKWPRGREISAQPALSRVIAPRPFVSPKVVRGPAWRRQIAPAAMWEIRWRRAPTSLSLIRMRPGHRPLCGCAGRVVSGDPSPFGVRSTILRRCSCSLSSRLAFSRLSTEGCRGVRKRGAATAMRTPPTRQCCRCKDSRPASIPATFSRCRC